MSVKYKWYHRLLIRHIFKKFVCQGYQHIVCEILRELFVAHQQAYTEDGNLSLRNYIVETLDLAIEKESIERKIEANNNAIKAIEQANEVLHTSKFKVE